MNYQRTTHHSYLYSSHKNNLLIPLYAIFLPLVDQQLEKILLLSMPQMPPFAAPIQIAIFLFSD